MQVQATGRGAAAASDSRCVPSPSTSTDEKATTAGPLDLWLVGGTHDEDGYSTQGQRCAG